MEAGTNRGVAMLAGIKESEITSLLEMSARIGSDPLLVQGGTGNTSVKIDGTMWIKASGKWLAHAKQDDLLVPLDLAEAQRCVRQNRDLTAEYTGQGGTALKPSIETAMHAVLPYKVVIHVHSINTIAWAVRADGPEQVGARLAGLLWRWIPYVASGRPLALEIEKDLAGSPGTDVFILANHGLVVCGDTTEDAEALLHEVDQRLSIEPRPVPPPDLDELKRVAERSEWRLPETDDLHALGSDPLSRKLVSKGILYPCQAIFLGPTPAERAAKAPFRIVADSGIVVSEKITRAERAILGGLMQVARRVDCSAPIRYLTESEVAHVLNADAYRYRALMENN
jgi:rhamnose utilization protein RhaD (predicted bifunctional aldolase and dehydrogenase)